MNTLLLQPQVRAYLLDNLSMNPSQLVLKGSPFEGITPQELAQQLVGLQKSKTKLPLWFANDKILFPPNLNLEQTSSHLTAQYKSKLVSGNTLIDVTGGFGIDTFYFSKQVKKVVHCELNENLHHLVHYNLKAFNNTSVETYLGDGIQKVLNSSNVDLVYIDPSRRNDAKGKVFFLEDCLPNVPEHLDALLNKSNQTLIKTAPILDVSIGIKELKYVKELHVVAVKNEVKELLWVLDKNYKSEILFKAINIIDESENYTNEIHQNDLEHSSPTYTQELGDYLYEPNSALLKLGAFNWLSTHYKVHKLHKHSHLYTNNHQVDFPGKKFKVLKVTPFSKKAMKVYNGFKANVISRNFKLSVKDIRTRFKIKESKNIFLFFTTNQKNEQIVIECERL